MLLRINLVLNTILGRIQVWEEEYRLLPEPPDTKSVGMQTHGFGPYTSSKSNQSCAQVSSGEFLRHIKAVCLCRPQNAHFGQKKTPHYW